MLILSGAAVRLEAQPADATPVGGVSRSQLVADLDRLGGEVAATDECG